MTDITFCGNHLFCGNKDCRRNPCHIKDPNRNYSFAKFPDCKAELRDEDTDKENDNG